MSGSAQTPGRNILTVFLPGSIDLVTGVGRQPGRTWTASYSYRPAHLYGLSGPPRPGPGLLRPGPGLLRPGPGLLRPGPGLLRPGPGLVRSPPGPPFSPDFLSVDIALPPSPGSYSANGDSDLSCLRSRSPATAVSLSGVFIHQPLELYHPAQGREIRVGRQ